MTVFCQFSVAVSGNNAPLTAPQDSIRRLIGWVALVAIVAV